MNLRKILFLSSVILLTALLETFAQTSKVSLSGKVTDAETGETIPFVVVHIKELSLWTTSDVNGNFSFKDVKPGEYTITSSCLGYKDFELKLNFNKNIERFGLKMHEETLALKEVTVTATNGRRLSTSSTIQKTALDHIQATSITDVMQLLPGAVTVNPNLNNPTKLTIRDAAGNDASNALGTSVVIDGARVSNDANMQMMSTSLSSQPNSRTTAGTGVDARQISVDNIESIEVIRGIASAEYGDVNSGVVIVRTKAGRSPFEVRFKADPKLKQIYGGKGFALGENRGFLNIDADFVKSFDDIRTSSKSYNRLTAQIGYSNVFNANGRAVSFNAKLKGYITVDNNKKDPDKDRDDKEKSEKREISLNLFGNWMVNKPWLTSIGYLFSGSYGKQYDLIEKEFTTSGIMRTLSMEEGEHIATYLPYSYTSKLEIEGKPVFLQNSITANISGRYGNILNDVKIGGVLNSIGNEGKGTVFDIEHHPYQSTSFSNSVRPRSFKEIPYINEIAGFIQNNFIIEIGKKSFELYTGLRLTKVKSKGIDLDAVLDPRINVKFVLVDNKLNKKGIQSLSVRGGWGLHSKLPNQAYLHPNDTYMDNISFNFRDDANNHSLGIITTYILKTENDNIKIPQNNKFEFGLDFKISRVNANITYFNETLKKAYIIMPKAQPVSFRVYNYSSSLVKPEYINGEVYDQGVAIGYETRKEFVTFRRVENEKRIDKWGLEYVLDFGKIDILQTSINFDGKYIEEKNFNNGIVISNPKGPAGTRSTYIGIYAGQESPSNGKQYKKLNTNLRLITHIPQLRLVATFGIQGIFIDKSRNISNYEGKRLAYMKDDDGNNVEGDIYKDEVYKKFVNPLAYMDLDGKITEFTEIDASHEVRKELIKGVDATHFKMNSYNPYFMLNVRLTKEIGRYAKLSFYANNFTNSKPWRTNDSTGYLRRVNSELSFGAEISLSF